MVLADFCEVHDRSRVASSSQTLYLLAKSGYTEETTFTLGCRIAERMREVIVVDSPMGTVVQTT